MAPRQYISSLCGQLSSFSSCASSSATDPPGGSETWRRCAATNGPASLSSASASEPPALTSSWPGA